MTPEQLEALIKRLNTRSAYGCRHEAVSALVALRDENAALKKKCETYLKHISVAASLFLEGREIVTKEGLT